MAYKTTKSSIRSRIDAGDFKAPRDWSAAQEGIMAGARIIAGGMKEEYLERKEEEKRKAAAAAKKAAEAKKKEQEAKERERKARALAVRLDASPTNSEAISYLTEQLFFFDDNAGTVYTTALKDLEDGRISFVDKETGPVQGPLLQPVTEDGLLIAKDSTVAALTNAGPDEKATIQANMDAAIADGGLEAQMNSILDQTGALSDEQIASQTYEGLQIDADAKKQEPIDWMTIKDPDQVQQLRRLHASGRSVLSEEDLKVLELYETDIETAKQAKVTAENVDKVRNIAGITDIVELQAIAEAPDNSIYSEEEVSYAKSMLGKREEAKKKEDTPTNLELLTELSKLDETQRKNIISAANDPKYAEDENLQIAVQTLELMTATDQADLEKYFTGISTVNGTEAAITRVEASQLSQADKDTVINKLNEHKKKIADETQELGLTDQIFYGQLADGTRIEVVGKENGGFYSHITAKSYTAAEFMPNTLISAENQTELSGAASRVQEKVIAPMNQKRADVVSLFRQASAIDNLVKSSDAKVLTIVGGQIPAFIQRVRNEYSSLESFLKGTEDIRSDIAALSEEPDAETLEALEEIGISADQYSRFKSQVIEFAYTYARTAMGQQRTTDADFEYAYKTITAGSSYPTYSNSLRELVTRGYQNAKTEHDLLLDHPSIASAELLPNYSSVFGAQMVALDPYLDTTDAGTVREWMQSRVDAPTTTNGDTPSEESDKTPEQILEEAVNTYQASPKFTADKQLLSSAPETVKEVLLTNIANSLNIPINLLRPLYNN
jgi:hypothetical protein